MKLFGLGVPELLIILAVALLIFGPKHLPKLGRAMGKTIKGLRDGLNSGDGVVKEVEVPEEDEAAEEPAPRRRKKKVVKAEVEEVQDDSIA